MMNSKIWMGVAVVATLAMAGCKGGDTTKTPAKTGDTSTSTTTTTTTTTTTDAGPKSTLSATVAFTGTAPAPAPLKREADAFCNKTKMTSEEVLVKDGKLQNVMVRVIAGAPNSAAPSTPVEMDQNNCMYRPRVLGVVAGQSVAIKNTDQTGHNVHTYKGEETCFNRGQPTPGVFTKESKDFCAVENGPITFKCDIHPWMTGYAIVNPNSYFAVTDAMGLAKIELPAGKYTLEAWHEKFGTKTAEVTVEAGKPAEVKFEYAGTEKSGT